MQKGFIGAFDSGVGGLSVLKELIQTLPHEDFVYIADQARIPYGTKNQEQIRMFSEKITSYLIETGAKCIVIPCNTASAFALTYLRNKFPNIPFIGMEPAVKSAVEKTKTGKVGVLATAGTFKSQRYFSLVERFAQNIEIFEDPCIGLVELIENQNKSETTFDLLKKVVTPMIKEDVDTIVLGCTHYPFVLDTLKMILPQNIQVIDPAPAVAKQTKKRLSTLDLQKTEGTGETSFYTTGEPSILKQQIKDLLAWEKAVEKLTI